MKTTLRHQGDEVHLLREIIRTYQVLIAGFSRKVGLPASKIALMRLLATEDEDVGVMDISRQLGVNVAAVTRQVKEMEAGGLLRRDADPGDRRRSFVRLSEKGHVLFEEIHERSHGLERALAEMVSQQEMLRTVDVLARLRGVIENHMKWDAKRR